MLKTPTHTPGPWFYVYGAVWTTPDGPEDGGQCIAQRAGEAKIKPYVRDANLRLASMAPALVDALQLVLEGPPGSGAKHLARVLLAQYRAHCCEEVAP